MRFRSLRGVVTSIGAGVALVTALSLPVAYFAAEFQNLSRHLEYKAELNAGYLAKYIVTHATLWQFQSVRLAELLGQTDGSDTNYRKQVTTSDNKVVLVEGPVPETPILARAKPVIVSGSNVGQIEIQASLRPMIEETALVAVFSSLLGLCAFFALRIFPIRVLDRTLGELDRSTREVATVNARLESALTNMSQGLCMFDRHGKVVLFNERYAKMVGLPAEKITGRSLLDLLEHQKSVGELSGDPQNVSEQILADVRQGRSSVHIKTSPNGRVWRVADEPSPSGGWVATFQDITEQRETEARMSHMATHDSLTNLPNRLFFMEQLERRLGLLGRDEMLSVISFDLDRFKSVNDTLGHAFGDLLLRKVAERTTKILREGDTLARLGGDEFAILQAHVEQVGESRALAERLIEDISKPFDLDGHQVVIGISIGLSLAPSDASDPGQLLKNADMALYRAKKEGKGTYRFFEMEMDRAMQARRTLELDLRKAIANGEFEVYFQPLVNLKDERVVGFEALLRWNHPTRGKISPLDFIPLAEETGLIIPIGEWVMRNACAEAAKWPSDINIAINLSPAQFKMRNLAQMVISALAQSGLAAGRLELEITESVLLLDNVSTLETLHTLRSLGVRISMDDFGTGYSSLSYLRSFPFDKIKIDRSFVHDLEREDSQAIIRAVSGLGASLGMAITGEGVETNAEAEYLRQEGCTQAQGFFYGEPTPASGVYAVIAKREAAAKAVA